MVVQTLEGEERVLEADSLLPFFGLSTNLGPIADWGMEMARKHVTIDKPIEERELGDPDLERQQKRLWDLMRDEAQAADMELADV